MLIQGPVWCHTRSAGRAVSTAYVSSFYFSSVLQFVPQLWKKPLEGRPSDVATVATAFVTKGTLFTEKYHVNILFATKYALNNKYRHHNFPSKIWITQQYRKVDIDTNTIRNTDLEKYRYTQLWGLIWG